MAIDVNQLVADACMLRCIPPGAMPAVKLAALCNASAAMAGQSFVTGDVMSVVIDPEGWSASITIKGLSTGGTYAMGLGTNNVTSAATKIQFTVVSLGYDDTGSPTTVTRTVYGTKQLRKVWPNDAQNDEVAAGGNVTVRVILSDYIYQKDNAGGGNSGTAVRVDILSGFYTQAGTPNNARSGITVTNNSTEAYPKVIGNWSWPGFEVADTSASGFFTLRCVAFHQSAQQGRPVRCIKFTITDGATTTQVINTVSLGIDAGMPDASGVIEYASVFIISGLNDGVLTANFIAYPWIGDSGSLLDTSAGNAQPHLLYGPLKILKANLTTYGQTMALVDTATGNDATGQAYDRAVYNPATANRFLTIGKAAAAIAAFNNTNHARNDVSCGIVELEAGNYAWLGSSNSYGTTPDSWITIRPKTGVARASVVINAQSGNGDISDRIKLENLTITVTTNNTFTNVNAIWLHKCDLNTTGAGLFNTTAGVCWMTQGKVTAFNQGFKPNPGTNCGFALVRGNDLSGLQHSSLCYTVIGNARTARSTPTEGMFVCEINGQATPQSTNFIVAFNNMLGWETGAAGRLTLECCRYVGPNTNGGAIIQNIFENCDGTGPMGDYSSSDSITTNTPIKNLLIWHNTIVGQRNFVGYNDAGVITKYRQNWSILNNYFDRSANKNDVFAPQNANRFGCWPISFQVNGSGNCHEQNMISLPGNFYMEFAGLSSYQPDVLSSGTLTHAEFVDRRSSDGTNPGAGGVGNYHISGTSPLRTLPIRWVLPVDMGGNDRSIVNSAGAYV